ncbi:MAG: hypothetical protein IKZ87_00225 [Actinomycetaceae bacterium]|nr:hypothetical protein [Actinomycetaceae bacterium]
MVKINVPAWLFNNIANHLRSYVKLLDTEEDDQIIRVCNHAEALLGKIVEYSHVTSTNRDDIDTACMSITERELVSILYFADWEARHRGDGLDEDYVEQIRKKYEQYCTERARIRASIPVEWEEWKKDKEKPTKKAFASERGLSYDIVCEVLRGK